MNWRMEHGAEDRDKGKGLGELGATRRGSMNGQNKIVAEAAPNQQRDERTMNKRREVEDELG